MWVLDGNGFTMAVSLSGEGTSPCIATQRGQERWRAPSTLPDQRSNIAERFHRVQGGWPEFSLPPHTRNNVRPADGVRPKTRRSKGGAHDAEQACIHGDGGRSTRKRSDDASRFRAVAAKRALPGSFGQDPRSELRQIPAWARQRGAHRHWHALVRGAGLVRRRPLPGVE